MPGGRPGPACDIMTPMLRRSFLALSAAAPFSAAVAQSRFALARTVAEWPFTASRTHAAPDELELDVVFRGPAGEHRVPAYWAGGSEWRVRFAAPAPGRYTYATVCSDTADTGLHARTGTFDAAPYNGANPLVLRGAPRVAPDRRHFEHDDGTPFFWLADTWWMGLCQRFDWPADFQQLTADRAAKGFTVVQIVAGLYPDMPPSTHGAPTKPASRGKRTTRASTPPTSTWPTSAYSTWSAAAWSPCIVGCWGYFLPWMGAAKMKQHWRYLVARWGAYPVVWCLAGEGTMPYYLSTAKERRLGGSRSKAGPNSPATSARWTPITARSPSTRAAAPASMLDDPSVLDFDMLQTGHGDRQSVPNTVTVAHGIATRPNRGCR